MGVVDVNDLDVLDLSDRAVQNESGIMAEDLTRDDYSRCHRIGDAGRGLFDGILAPSAALPGRRTLVIFPEGMSKVTVVSSRVRQPPPRIADLINDIRFHRDVPAAVRGYLRRAATAGAEAIRGRR